MWVHVRPERAVVSLTPGVPKHFDDPVRDVHAGHVHPALVEARPIAAGHLLLAAGRKPVDADRDPDEDPDSYPNADVHSDGDANSDKRASVPDGNSDPNAGQRNAA